MEQETILKKIILESIRLYQVIISPLLRKRCRFYPSCSEYLALSVEKYGPSKGLWFGIKRLMKCQPLNKGGTDLP